MADIEKIGLTGGIGSGKSAVAEILRGLGATVIDTDRIGHEVYEPNTPGWTQVVEAFGAEIVDPDGRINRPRLGAIVFGDSTALVRLNQIVHPLIGLTIQARIEEYNATGNPDPLVIEAAILIEAGWHTFMDQVWLVTAPEAVVADRLQRLRGMNRAAVDARMKVQFDDLKRRPFATVIIENGGTLEQLRGRVAGEWQRARSRSST